MNACEPNDISLISTNVADNTEDEWSSATTYSVGDQIQVTTETPHKVYESLRDNNLNRAPADYLEPVEEVGHSISSVTIETGTKSFTVETGMTFSVAQVVLITKTTAPSTQYMTAEVTSYDSSTGVLTVSVYSSTGSGTHTDWTITTQDEIGYWEEVSSTNQWLMFDDYVNTQTENTTTIEVELNVELVDYVAFFGVEAKLIEVELWDAADTELLCSGELDLIYGSSVISEISDWYEYFFGELSAREDGEIYLDVITYSGILKITITADDGETAKCGHVLIGRSYDLGTTEYGAGVGIVDYSLKETDDLGRTTITQGYWAKQHSATLTIQNDDLDSIYKLMARLRGVPTAWSANNDGIDYEAFVVFGIYTDFDIVLKNKDRSICTLEIEGLT